MIVTTPHFARAELLTSACNRLPPLGSEARTAVDATLAADAHAKWKQAEGSHVHLALVFGNNYSNAEQAPPQFHVQPLKNPERDAENMRQLLNDKGYTAVCILGVTSAEMIDTMSALNWALLDAHTSDRPAHSLVYFAGHGGEDKDGQWLVPANFDEESEGGHQLELVNLEDMLSLAPSWDDLNPTIFVIDACRTPPADSVQTRMVVDGKELVPFTRAHERRNAPRPPYYTLIFSTAPGESAGDGPDGGNGPFMQELTSVLSGSTWTQPADPTLLGIVKTVETLLLAAHVEQRPAGPIMPAGEDYELWVAEYGPDNPAYYLWKLGLMLHSWNRHIEPAYRTAICEQKDGVLGRFSGQTSDPQRPWIGELVRALTMDFSKTTCDRIFSPQFVNLDQGVRDSILTLSSGTAVRAAPGRGTLALSAAPGTKMARTLPSSAFNAGRFKLDCSSQQCSGDRVYVVGDVLSAYVPANNVQAIIPAQRFAVAINPDTGDILPGRFDAIMTFLNSAKQAGTLNKINLKLVIPQDTRGPQTPPPAPPFALLKILQLGNVLVDRVGLREEQVLTAPIVRVGGTDWLSCSTFQVQGSCLLVEIIQ